MKDDKEIMVFVTKYALTQGIMYLRVLWSEDSPGMVRTPGSFRQHFHTEGKDWHRTAEGAIDRAEEMRVNAIASAEKKIKRLRQIKFVVKQ